MRTNAVSGMRGALRTLMAVCLSLAAAGLLFPTDAGARPYPLPYVQSVSPLATVPGGAQFTLTVDGTGFTASSTVMWNSTALTTTFVTGEQLTAVVTPTLIVSSGTAWITVTNPGGKTSNLIFFPVGNGSAVVNFATIPLTAGASPVTVAEGDFNGDGKMDLVTSNWTADTLSVFLSNGDGTFQTPTTISLSSASTDPVGLAVGDINGDGKLDVVVGYESGSGISVLLGNGDGTFQAPVTTAAGSNTYAIVLGDFNNDGRLDVAASNYSGGEVQVLRGNGDGTFQTAVPYAVGTEDFYVHEADLNGDGNLDLVVGDFGGTTVSVLLGNGDGTFASQVTYTAGTGVGDFAIGDFTGDGIPDLMVTGQSDNNMYLLAGNGDGTFQTAQAVNVGFSTQVVAAADFNADGKLDLSVIKASGGVAVMLGNGDGTFQAAQSFTGASFTYGILTGNFNTGGGIGIATTDFDTGNLDVLLPTMSLAPASINFGNQAIGVASLAQSFTLTNSTSQTVALAGISFTGTNALDYAETDNCGTSLASGASCTIQVTFKPSGAGASSGTLNIADNAPASPQTAAVSGTGLAAPVVSLSSAAVTFTSQTIGVASAAQTVTVTNAGSAVLNISGITVGGTNSGDFNETNNCGATLAQSAMCTISVTFTPGAAGARSAAISIADDASDSPESITLSGTGATPLPTATLSANTVTFTPQVVGAASTAQTVTLTNNGTVALTVASIAASGSNAADFAVTNNCGSSVAASGHCTISATFTPGASGTRTATITITDSAADSPQTVALNGTGQDFSLALASPSTTVAAGSTATLQLAVTPTAGFNEAVTLACSGAPANSTCTVTPSSVTPSNAPVNVTIALTTTAHISPWVQFWPTDQPGGGSLARTLLMLLLATAMAMALWGMRAADRRPTMRTALFALLLLISGVGLAACGNTSTTQNPPTNSNRTPAGTYTVTVTGTAGTLARTVTAQLTVQ